MSGAMGLALVLAGCAPATTSETAPAASAPSTVQVTTRDLAPVISLTGSVTATATFQVLAPQGGQVQFSSGMRSGSRIAAGGIIATVGGAEVRVPVEAVVGDLRAAAGASVPDRYPLATMSYSGFAVAGAIEPNLSWLLLSAPLTGRGQISAGPGPFDCAAVVTSAGASPADATGSSGAVDPASMLCLVPKEVDAAAGAQAITVLTATTVAAATVLPLSAVAGRSGSGQVTVVDGDERRPTSVALGSSDGQYIQILSGVTPGQVVDGTAPNLSDKRIP
ncbi:hypothetical protein [Clavibacter sp. km1a]|uniref:hypothetical protein n=1 Tax=Clavibacter sp. km1a TaxID=3459136 RepID=UPI0040429C1E